MQNRKDIKSSRFRMDVMKTILVTASLAVLIWGYQKLNFYNRIQKGDTRIAHHGKVIDHHGDPVAGADVQYSITRSMDVWMGGSGSQKATITNKNGEFEIGPCRAWSVRVRSISKPGYRFLQKGLQYAIDKSAGEDRNTLEFVLVPERFDFYSVVRFNDERLNFTWNSEIIEKPLGKSGETVIFRPFRNSKWQEGRGFEWRVEIGIKNGTILMVPDRRVVLLAPLDGYRNKIVVGHRENNPLWSRMIRERTFIFKTDNGKYGTFDLSLAADHKDGKFCGFFSGTFNPRGERFLD